MNEEVRVTLFRNSLNPVNGKDVLVDIRLTLKELLRSCSSELGINAKKIYTGNGTVLNSPRSLKDGASLYISQGEPFFVRSPKVQTMPRSNYSLVLLGASGVGKTSIAKRYVNCVFENFHDSSIEDFYLKQTMLDKEQVSISILDTNGSEGFDTLKDSWIRKKDAIILVHSGDVPESLEYLQQDYSRICTLHNIESLNAPLIVLATNKSDLNYYGAADEGRYLARCLGIRQFDISAALNTGIDAMLTFILKKIQERREQIFKPESRSRSYCSECALL
mmetsp:Transcript_28728/g.51120  ORF Transcript_28728/g.51120 Transcript_28728/m.51120 type:complete len:277 (+) Transcript_28728:1762-2592(+)